MLVRFDPFRDLDRVWESFTSVARTPSMPMDALRRGDHLYLSFDLPGVDPESIDLTVERNELTVTAERSLPRRDGDEWLVAERPSGRVSRQLLLGENLDTDHIEASYTDGVLEVVIPIAEAARPRKVPIGTGAARGAIDAGTTES